MLRLGVTRDAARLKNLAEAANRRGVHLIPLPVISVEPVAFSWPKDLDITDLDWIFFTSANGVTSFFKRLSGLNLQLGPKTRIAAIGEKTSIAISTYEHTTDFIPEAAYGRQLFHEFVELTSRTGTTVLYARGESINFDPTELLNANKVKYFPLICYRTAINQVPADLLNSFSREDYILFTAPSAVESFSAQFGRPLARAIAIGKSTAQRMGEYQWNDIIVMDKPDIEKVLEYI